MRLGNSLTLAVASLVCALSISGAEAQTIQRAATDIALKNGETAEIGDVYYISPNCKSLLKGIPEVEILDGPPGVTAAVNAAKIVPRSWGCANPVPGGKIVVTAKDVQEYSFTRMVLRINYKTLNGDRQRSENINLVLFPPN